LARLILSLVLLAIEFSIRNPRKAVVAGISCLFVYIYRKSILSPTGWQNLFIGTFLAILGIGLLVFLAGLIWLFIKTTMAAFAKKTRSYRQIAFSLTVAVLAAVILNAAIYEGSGKAQIDRENDRLSEYTPSKQIQDFTAMTTMTDYAKRLLYLNRPNIITDKQAFRSICRENIDQTSATLGCYFRHDGGIYILDMNDSRLAGLMGTTIAHEVLHAAYERLGPSERATIDKLLAQIMNGHNGKDIELRLKIYPPGKLMTEVHSIAGTEVADLPRELESYYSKYFGIRQRIVTLAKEYETERKTRYEELESYAKQLAALKSEIDRQEKTASELKRQINILEGQIGIYREGGDIEAHNELVPRINKKIGELTGLAHKNDEVVTKYNDLVKRRNSIVSDALKIKEAMGFQNSHTSISLSSSGSAAIVPRGPSMAKDRRANSGISWHNRVEDLCNYQ